MELLVIVETISQLTLPIIVELMFQSFINLVILQMIVILGKTAELLIKIKRPVKCIVILNLIALKDIFVIRVIKIGTPMPALIEQNSMSPVPVSPIVAMDRIV